MAAHEDSAEPTPRGIEALVAAHRRFLAFIEPRVATRADAEELLQTASVKAVEHAADIREDESAVAWFYRLLRNAVVDYYRHRDAERRALAARGSAGPAGDEFDPALREVVCECLHTLLPALPDSYSGILREVDLAGVPLRDAAARRGITPNNARVTLHRARRALKRQLELSCGTCTVHGCLDCSCGG